jgi:hypothetical protein
MREFKESISHETAALPETTTEQKTADTPD